MPSRLTTTHPGKAIYTLGTVGWILARLPFWLLYYLRTSSRPSKHWSYRQAIQVQILKALIKNFTAVEIKTPESLNPGKEGKQFIVIKPAPSSYYTGIVLKDETLKPRALGGTWYPAPLAKYTGSEDVVLHFHGGAFVIGDGRKEDNGHLATTIINNTPATHAFCPQYRLSSNPGGQFPAALQDAITAIQYLALDVGVPASRITVSGDSAGANLVLALLKYIHDHPETNVASPSAGFLWSAWVDPSGSLVPGAYENVTSDYLTSGFGAWGARTYEPRKSTGVTLSDSYIKFRGNAFPTTTPLFWSGGECEALLPEITATYELFKAVPGNKCEFFKEVGAPHDVILVAPLLGFFETAIVTAKAAGKFLEGLKR